MASSRSAKRDLTALVAVLMLLCQSLAFADACVARASGNDSSSAPCHDSGDSGPGSIHDRCESGSPASGFSVDLHAVTDLPAITVQVVLAEPKRTVRLAEVSQSCFEPPPLRFVCCRLRN
jgi:hypothetical protein